MKNSLFLICLLLVAAGATACAGRDSRVPLPRAASLDPAQRGAIENARAAVLNESQSGRAWGEYGMLLRSLGFHAEAQTCFQEAEARDKSDPRWPYFLARSPHATDPRASLQWLRRAVDLCGNHPEAPRYYLAKTLVEENRWAEAEKELSLLLTDHPRFTPALLLRAQAALHRQDFSAAAALLESCADDPRTRKAAAALLAAVRQRQGESEAARAAAQKAASLPADAPVANLFESQVAALRQDARLLSDQAHRLLAARDLTNATIVADRLERDHPSAPETWLILGRLRFLQGDRPGAKTALLKHLELQPNSTQGLFQLGLVQLSANEFEAAAATFTAATGVKPDFGAAWFNQGFALARSGKIREAIRAFRETIRHNPEHLESYLLLADLYLRQNDTRAASNLLAQAALLHPDHPGLTTMRNRIRAKLPAEK